MNIAALEAQCIALYEQVSAHKKFGWDFQPVVVE